MPAGRPTILATSMGFNRARDPWKPGLGFLPYSNAVHYSDRRKLFHECIAHGELPRGYATDVGAGLHFEGIELMCAVSDRSKAGAYRVGSSSGRAKETSLEIRRLRS